MRQCRARTHKYIKAFRCSLKLNWMHEFSFPNIKFHIYRSLFHRNIKSPIRLRDEQRKIFSFRIYVKCRLSSVDALSNLRFNGSVVIFSVWFDDKIAWEYVNLHTPNRRFYFWWSRVASICGVIRLQLPPSIVNWGNLFFFWGKAMELNHFHFEHGKKNCLRMSHRNVF